LAFPEPSSARAATLPANSSTAQLVPSAPFVGGRGSLCFRKNGTSGGEGRGITFVLKGGANGKLNGNLDGNAASNFGASAGVNIGGDTDDKSEADIPTLKPVPRPTLATTSTIRLWANQFGKYHHFHSKNFSPCTEKHAMDKDIEEAIDEAALKCLKKK
jgi:hypothetical protein